MQNTDPYSVAVSVGKNVPVLHGVLFYWAGKLFTGLESSHFLGHVLANLLSAQGMTKVMHLPLFKGQRREMKVDEKRKIE